MKERTRRIMPQNNSLFSVHASKSQRELRARGIIAQLTASNNVEVGVIVHAAQTTSKAETMSVLLLDLSGS